MAKPLSHSPHDQSAATLRQLKLLVVLLVLSNIGLGIFSVYLLRVVDHRYSELIERSVPVLNDLQTLTAQSVDAMRGTGPLLMRTSGAERDEILRRSRQAVERDRLFREKILKSEWLLPATGERAEVKRVGDEFTRMCLEVLRLVASGQAEEASRLRDENLRKAFEHYLTVVTKAADVLEAESMRVNEDFSARTGNMSTVLLGLASWPVIILAGLLLLTAVFVVVLMILFRGREMGDMP